MIFVANSDVWSEISIKIVLSETGRGYYMREKTIKCRESLHNLIIYWIVSLYTMSLYIGL